MSDDALARAAGLGFDDYRPGVVVAAVNAILHLGQAGALDRISLHADRTGMFWVLRTAFEMRSDTPHPPVRLGAPDPPPPPAAASLPRFPIVLAHDVPLLAVSGYDLAGLAQTPADHIAAYREHATLRATPLDPATDADAVLTDFLTQWTDAYAPAPPDVTARIRSQITEG